MEDSWVKEKDIDGEMVHVCLDELEKEKGEMRIKWMHKPLRHHQKVMEGVLRRGQSAGDQ